MGKKEKNETLNKVGIVVAIMFVIFYFILTIISFQADKENCIDKLGVIYGIDVSSVDVYHEYFDKNHYNCCWDEVELSDEGYYTTRKCRGFVK